MDGLRHLVRREALAAVVDEFCRVFDVAGDECGDGLAAVRIGNADDRGFAHVAMRREHPFDLGWVDVDAAADDDLLVATP